MGIERSDTDSLTEEWPAPGVLMRYRAADLVVEQIPRGGPRLTLRQGAVWVRVAERGPGVTLIHGAITVQVRDGAAVVDSQGPEALMVVVAGRAAVKGTAALPRSVLAGHAVVLAVDGSFGPAEALTPAELAADHFVAENLVRDALVTVTQPDLRSDDGESDPARPDAGAAGGPGGPPPGMPAEPPSPAGGPGSVGQPGASSGPVVDDPVVEAFDGAGLPDLSPLPREGSSTRRRAVLALVVVVLLVAAVVAAVMLGGERSSARQPLSARSSTLPVGAVGAGAPLLDQTTRVTTVAQGQIDACAFEEGRYVVRGTASGGGSATIGYAVTVGIVDADGEVYAQHRQEVEPRADPAQPATWSVAVTIPDDEPRPGSTCTVISVENLVAPSG